MEQKIKEYLLGRRIKIDDYNLNYSTDIHYCNKVYTIYFFFHDINMTITYCINENLSYRISTDELMKYIVGCYIPQKINENVNVKVYLRKLKIQKIKSNYET